MFFEELAKPKASSTLCRIVHVCVGLFVHDTSQHTRLQLCAGEALEKAIAEYRKHIAVREARESMHECLWFTIAWLCFAVTLWTGKMADLESQVNAGGIKVL